MGETSTRFGSCCIAAWIAAAALGCSNDELKPLGSDETVDPNFGRIVGKLCDRATGSWMVDVKGELTISQEDVRTVDANGSGEMIFEEVPPGNYIISFLTNSLGVLDFPAIVRGGETTHVGPSACDVTSGSIHGRICGGDGFWLGGATVSVSWSAGIASSLTDSDGYFTLTGVPPGDHTVVVEKGSFSTTFEASVQSGQQSELPEPVCIPPETHVAVITGVYDSVENVLNGLGFPNRNTYDNSTIPSVDDPEGNVDIISGTFGDFWLTSFLNDPVWMDDYDIIFFNCGIDDSALMTGSAAVGSAITNLQNFVNNGGSVYASDWASEIVRVSFPGHIDFYGNDAAFNESRVGKSDPNFAATVVDVPLAAALGENTLTINLDLPQWSMLAPIASQPGDLVILVKGNPQYCTSYGLFGCSGYSTQSETPVVVRFDYGTGRVLYTSAHNEPQNTADLDQMLNLLVFEL